MVLADGDLWFVSFVFGQNGGQDLIESLQQCSGKKILFKIFKTLLVSLYITIYQCDVNFIDISLLPTENGSYKP